jgi:hypothetical protein
MLQFFLALEIQFLKVFYGSRSEECTKHSRQSRFLQGHHVGYQFKTDDRVRMKVVRRTSVVILSSGSEIALA